ncbi:hypothetical protein, partial [Pseudomonas aegrilactucae]
CAWGLLSANSGRHRRMFGLPPLFGKLIGASLETSTKIYASNSPIANFWAQSAIKKLPLRQLHPAMSYFFEDLLGFKSGLFPGVSLLSRRRLSTSPVDLAIGFGPGLSAIRSPSITTFKLTAAK